MSKTIAAESARFYDRKGNVITEIPKADGKGMRKPTIADARKHGYLPSVSNVLKRLAAPQLDAWKQAHAVVTALANPIARGETEDDWVLRVSQASKEYGKLAADRGTEIHAQIEKYITTGESPPDPAAGHACNQIVAHFGADCAWTAEESFAETILGFAGRPDLSGTVKKTKFVADFKTTSLPKFKSPFYNWGLQLAGYRLGLGLPKDTNLIQVVIDRDSGDTQFHYWGEGKTSHEPAALTDAFLCLLAEWKLYNKYNSGDK